MVYFDIFSTFYYIQLSISGHDGLKVGHASGQIRSDCVLSEWQNVGPRRRNISLLYFEFRRPSNFPACELACYRGYGQICESRSRVILIRLKQVVKNRSGIRSATIAYNFLAYVGIFVRVRIQVILRAAGRIFRKQVTVVTGRAVNGCMVYRNTQLNSY